MNDYRADIDGLRAVAVLLVMLFHLGVDGLSGGYIGVDIFFVISGFLITRQIALGMQSRTFSLKAFYIRRIRRIVPALYVTLMLTLIVGSYIFDTEDLSNTTISALFASVFLSNSWFWYESDYFESLNQVKPLLHTWSLGVEAQFYAIFPLLIYALWKIPTFWVKYAISLILIAASIGLSIYFTWYDKVAAFYLLPFRFFEFLVGGVCFWFSQYYTGKKILHTILWVLGFALIGYAAVSLDNDSLFPGLLALYPTLGSALIMMSANQSIFAWSLNNKVATFIGKISYSLYLVHLPIIIFYSYAQSQELTLFDKTIITILSFFMASLMYFFVEQPFRRKLENGYAVSSKPLLFCCLTAFIMILFLGLSLYKTTVMHRHQQPGPDFYQFDYVKPYRSPTCFLELTKKPEEVFSSQECLKKPFDGKSILLWGDSHAAHLYHGFHHYLSKDGINVWQATARRCQPLLDYHRGRICKEVTDYFATHVLSQDYDVIVIAGAWRGRKKELAALSKTIHYLESQNKKVVLIGRGIGYKKGFFDIIKRYHRLENKDEEFIHNFFNKKLLRIDKKMGTYVRENHANVRYISILENVCDAHQCPIYYNNFPILWDANHLTKEGSRLVAKKILPDILGYMNEE